MAVRQTVVHEDSMFPRQFDFDGSLQEIQGLESEFGKLGIEFSSDLRVFLQEAHTAVSVKDLHELQHLQATCKALGLSPAQPWSKASVLRATT